jgi:hypothetical protein
MILGMALGPAANAGTLEGFIRQVRPPGFWPGRSSGEAVRQLAGKVGGVAMVVAGVVVALQTGVWLLFGG